MLFEITTVFVELGAAIGVLSGVSKADLRVGGAEDDRSINSLTSGARGEWGLCLAEGEAMLK